MVRLLPVGKILPEEEPVLQRHVSMAGAALGNGGGTGVEDEDPVRLAALLDVGVSVQQDVPCLQRGKTAGIPSK